MLGVHTLPAASDIRLYGARFRVLCAADELGCVRDRARLRAPVRLLRHLHLLFRNALMVVDRALFGRFRASLASLDTEEAMVSTPVGRRVILRTTSSPSAYLFTRAELTELRRLVDGASLMLELDGEKQASLPGDNYRREPVPTRSRMPA